MISTVTVDETTLAYAGPGTLAAFKAANGIGSADFPAQSGHSGQYLTTNGTAVSWAAIVIPSSTVTSAMIVDGTIVNADIAPGAAITASKIAGLATSATTDATNASNITSGTLDDARLTGNVALVNTYNPMNRAASITADRSWSPNGHIFSIGPLQIQDNSVSTSGSNFTTDAGNIDLTGGHITDVGNGGISFLGTGAADTATNLNGYVLLLAGNQTVTGVKKWGYHTFVLKGAITGEITVDVPDDAGTNAITFPAETGTLSLRETTNSFTATGNAFTKGLTVTTSDADGANFSVFGDGGVVIASSGIFSMSGQSFAFLHPAGDMYLRPAGVLYVDTATAVDVDAAVPVTIHGNLTVGGTLTGTLTGNASTATKLATARAINGTNFDGSAPITITAAANTLTGTTLAAAVVHSSITDAGVFTALNTSGAITLSGTGGASYICLPYQSAAPATPAASKALIYANAVGQPAYMQPDGVATIIPTSSRRRTVDLYTDFLSTSQTDGFMNSSSGTGALASGMATAVAGHPGIRTLVTGTTTTGNAGQYSSTALNAMILGGGACVFEECASVVTLSDGTDTFTVRAGLLQSTTTESTDGVFFRYTHGTVSGHWQGVCRAAGVESTADLTDAVLAGQYDTLRFEVNAAATSVTFYVNGVSRGTITGNINTTVANGVGTQIIKSAGTTSRTLNVDFISWHQDLTALR